MSENKNKIAAAVFNRLVSHLQEHTDVQNIDIMETAGFCRNCLSRWYREESEKLNIEISENDSKELVYGMAYSEWKEKFQI